MHVRPPCPGVSEPQGRQDMQRSGFGSAVECADLDQDGLWRVFGIFHEHVEVAVAFEDTCVQKLVFHFGPRTSFACSNQVIIRESRLRIFVQVLHVGMGRRAVKVEVILFDILTMVAFAVGQPKQAFFQYGILAVPQSNTEAEQLLLIADTSKAVLAPVIGAGSRLIMGEVVPCISIFAIVFPNGSPLTLAKIGAPLFPRGFRCPGFFESGKFLGLAHAIPVFRSRASWRRGKHSLNKLIYSAKSYSTQF